MVKMNKECLNYLGEINELEEAYSVSKDYMIRPNLHQKLSIASPLRSLNVVSGKHTNRFWRKVSSFLID